MIVHSKVFREEDTIRLTGWGLMGSLSLSVTDWRAVLQPLKIPPEQ